MRVLITGGAGFIGRHLIRALVAEGHQVDIIDSLEEQVHPSGDWPDDIPKDVLTFPWRVSGAVAQTFSPFSSFDYDAVFHLAARVGVGQAQYQIADYIDANVGDTAEMLQFWADNPERRPKRLIVASSMSVYGEGEMEGSRESDPLYVPNIYAQTKYDQERYCIIAGTAYGIPTTALRFFNVYGPGQSLSNPYTGVAAMFAARLLGGKGGLIYEDGLQTRDFIHVSDIVRGLMLALDAPEEEVAGNVFNLGTGTATTLRELHFELAQALGHPELTPIVTGIHRKGDIRHCYANTSKARSFLRFQSRVSLRDGMKQYADWLRTQDLTTIRERVDAAHAELVQRGLVT